MLDQLISPTDIARRTQLRNLERTNQTSDFLPRFRVRAWRWHHLGIVRDLSRLERGLSRAPTLCSVGHAGKTTRAQVLDALNYILEDNWKLHNFVERSLFVPWLSGKKPADPALRRHIQLVAEERDRLRKDAQGLTKAVHKWVHAEPAHCTRELGSLTGRVRKLRENAARLFGASEAVFVPRVVSVFDDKEQGTFNRTVLKNITGRQARISLIIFGDAVQQSDPIVATETDAADFENDIPAPIRRLAMPYWRSKFIGQRIKFITGEEYSKQ